MKCYVLKRVTEHSNFSLLQRLSFINWGVQKSKYELRKKNVKNIRVFSSSRRRRPLQTRTRRLWWMRFARLRGSTEVEAASEVRPLTVAFITVNRPRSAEFLVGNLLLLCTCCDVVPRISKSVISLQPHSRSVYSTLFSFNFISHSSVLLQRCGECESKRKPYHPRVAIQHPRCAADFKSQRRCWRRR